MVGCDVQPNCETPYELNDRDVENKCVLTISSVDEATIELLRDVDVTFDLLLEHSALGAGAGHGLTLRLELDHEFDRAVFFALAVEPLREIDFRHSRDPFEQTCKLRGERRETLRSS